MEHNMIHCSHCKSDTWEENDQKALLEDRRLIDYIMPSLYSLLGELDDILTKLNNDTYAERITETKEVPSKGKKPVIKIGVRPLSVLEMQKVINDRNLSLTLKRIKDMLISVNYLTVTPVDVLAILESIPYIIRFHFENLIREDDSKYDISLWLIDLRGAIKELNGLGYAKPEKYNQPYYFIVKKSIALITRLGY